MHRQDGVNGARMKTSADVQSKEISQIVLSASKTVVTKVRVFGTGINFC